MSETRPEAAADDELVAQGLAGSQAALVELYRRHRPRVYRYVLRMTGNRELADEIFCATFATFFERLKRYRPSGRLAGYLLRIARSRLLDELAARSRLGRPLPTGPASDGPAPPADPSPTPDEAASADELADRVQRAVAALAEPLREVVVLRLYEDLDYATIAGIVGVGEATLRSRMRYALAALRRAVDAVPDANTPPS